MVRNRVLSFISQLSAPGRDSRTPTPTSSPSPDSNLPNSRSTPHSDHDHGSSSNTTPSPPLQLDTRQPYPATPAPASPTRGEPTDAARRASISNSSTPSSPTASGRKRSNSRPLSMVQTYQPPLMDVNEDTLPELQPIFTFLNSHTNKLYQEGYFLKLDDQDIKGKPNPDRTWTECFAQLVGTVLSLWDAAELDAAGEDGEVLPKFINLTDASIKMIESLPTRTNDEQPLQNILSISTAGRNRYLLHFNSHHSLIQWTSGIRLAMFEHLTLQEAYTGALIAGKGKNLNSINIIMERARLPIQEWVRVRFGAGVPWRRCFCVIEPPNEKEYQKAQKDFKKRSPYDRSHPPILKGQIRFYDSKKEAEKKKKHQRPIASITDAYSAYAIYPQSKALIDGSTLLKVEGDITIHSDPPSSTEGFVFIMPESHPMVTGFEMLLRFLFPTWDTFGLYGRPGRLVASVLDPRSLMFGMPKHKRYGYLELMDVSGLILTDGSSTWTEQEWRKKLKELTGRRMTAVEEAAKNNHSRSESRNSKRLSFGPPNTGSARPRVGFADDSTSVRSSRSMSLSKPGPRTDSAPPDPNRIAAPTPMEGHSRHSRNISDSQLTEALSSHGLEGPGTFQGSAIRAQDRARTFASDLASTPERLSSEDDRSGRGMAMVNNLEMQRMQTPEPVNAPPAFAHTPGSQPQQKPYHSPEMRRANSRLSSTTLSQLANAGGLSLPDDGTRRLSGEEAVGPAATANVGGMNTSLDSSRQAPAPGQPDPRGPAVQPQASASPIGMNANFNASREALTPPINNIHPPRSSSGLPPPPHIGGLSQNRSMSPIGSPTGPGGGPSPGFRLGPPPGHPGGRGGPPMNSRGPPPPGYQDRGFPPGPPDPLRDPRMGPLPPGPDGYPSYQQRGPPPGPRRTPPPGQGMPRPPPHMQGQTSPVHRKPLPQRTTSLQRPGDDGVSPLSAQSPPPSGAFPQQIPHGDGYGRPLIPPQHPNRQNNERSAASSVYDDASSTASPDYASTRRSTDTQESVDRPRAGVLKTIGDDAATTKSEFDIPDINFGPTFNYGASNILASKLAPPITSTVNSAQLQQQSGRKSPGPGPAYSHFREGSDDTLRRTVAWQPGATVGTTSTDNIVSPEQFVQQRAAAAPMYAHSRNHSANTLTDFRAGTPTSPLKRPGSHGHSRHSSADLLQSGRPVSQGTAAALSGGEVSSYLSAREQEHVARVTGSPLIALAGNRGVGQPQAGLVGAIEHRERERAQMKQGIGGQAVAQAIDQRQREQNQQAQRAAQAAYAQQQAQFTSQQGYAGPQSPVGMNMMGGGAPSVYAPTMPAMNPRSMSPGPGMMNGGMPAGRLGPGFQPAPGYGPQQQSRPQMMPPQGSYNNGPPVGQGFPQGRQIPNMQHRPPPLGPPSTMALQGGQPQSPGFQAQSQGQFTPNGTPGRPGTPGRIQFQGQAF
ncbi:hypothetical protein B0H63DRAFT_517710 [Podospora didyma]|uniref:PH domain-containing protein n=1 Tax=Podospora didyma TaxID=330526 RepID=A0AAE0U872_9PEZI|nr:hypothetical protein B0H63DRAFT_517710 [Podospora didyma]